MKPTARSTVAYSTLLVALVLTLAATRAAAQFQFNFNASGGSVVPGIANQTCGGGGMGGGGNCDGTRFIQEVVTVGGTEYYHVVVGDGGSEFAIEYYMRTSGLCWFGCANARVTGGMGGGGMGGGGTPLSSSMGDAADDGDPLSNRNAGTGAPDRVAVRQINNTPEMAQEFLKATETRKPKITQALNVQDMQMDFMIDMSNSDYRTSATAGTTSLTQTINIPGLPDPTLHPVTQQPLPDARSFDLSKLTPTGVSVRDITGGRFTYTPGSGDGGSLGTYSYFADTFDVYNVDWVSYCNPAQNPASQCVNYPSVRGGMGGAGGGQGGGQGGGAMGGMAVAANTSNGATTGGTTTVAGAMGGGGAMSVGGSSGVTATTTATTTSSRASGSTTTVRSATTTTIPRRSSSGLLGTTTSSSTILTTTSTTRRATTTTATTSTTSTTATTLPGGRR